MLQHPALEQPRHEQTKLRQCHWCQQTTKTAAGSSAEEVASSLTEVNYCLNCGMPAVQPKSRLNFKMGFWLVVSFCIIMMIILPRGFIF